MNWFRIRADSSIEGKHTEHEMMQGYTHHVQRIKDRVPDDLLQYFGTDFFHDGHIDSVQSGPDHTDVIMTIWGPNIKYWKDPHTYEYCSVEFQVVFADVVVFEIHIEKVNASNDPLHDRARSTQYLYGEIESLSDDIARYDTMYASDELQFHSLVFQTVPCDRWYTLIFADVSVWAKESVAFELMTRDPRYEIPTYDMVAHQKAAENASEPKTG